jgi:hypothetical protein
MYAHIEWGKIEGGYRREQGEEGCSCKIGDGMVKHFKSYIILHKSED